MIFLVLVSQESLNIVKRGQNEIFLAHTRSADKKQTEIAD